MLGYALRNQSTDPGITSDVLFKMAGALSVHLNVVLNQWQRLPMAVGVGDAIAGYVGAVIVDELDDPEALAYHSVDANGNPVVFIGWGIIKSNGETLFGPDGLTSAAAHEFDEAAIDPYADFWADMPDGKTEVPIEVCDPLQGEDFDDDTPGIFMPNFCLPRWFRDVGAGPYDYRGQCSSPFELRGGGYLVKRMGGPTGSSSDVFGARMPAWKRIAKQKPGTRRSKRHA